MKILLIDGAIGSAERARHVSSLAVGLKNRGHSVTIVCGCAREYRHLRADGITVIGINLRLGAGFASAIEVYKVIRQGSFDIIHTHCSWSGLLCRAIARLACSAKLIHTLYSISENRLPVSDFPNELKQPLCRVTNRILSSLCDTVIATSTAIKRTHRNSGINPARIETIYAGVDGTSFHSRSDKARSRNKLMIPNGCLVVGTVAPLTRRNKDLSNMIRAAKVISKKLNNIMFVIIGDGIAVNDLRQLSRECGIEHKVLFANDRTDIPELLPAFDIFTASTQYEGFQLSMLEAMAASLPVVAPESPIAREILVDGLTGHIVTSDDVDAMASGICRIFEDGNGVSMGKAARDRVQNLFSMDRMIERTERVYVECLSRQTSGITASALR